MSLHLPHDALTLALTASSDPPSSLMVTPKYLNLFTCLRLVPWLSLMFTFVPFLLLTITSAFPILTSSPLLSIPICHPSHLLSISSSVSVSTARSSENSSSLGNPHLNSSLMTSNTTINRYGLSRDLWCRPTLMGNSSDAQWYVALLQMYYTYKGMLLYYKVEPTNSRFCSLLGNTGTVALLMHCVYQHCLPLPYETVTLKQYIFATWLKYILTCTTMPISFAHITDQHRCLILCYCNLRSDIMISFDCLHSIRHRICSPIVTISYDNINYQKAEKGLKDTLKNCFVRNCPLVLEQEYE